MRWRLTYIIRSYGITEDEPLWTDKEHVLNVERVETDIDTAKNAKTFLEKLIQQNASVQSYELVRIIQEEVTIPIKMPPLKSYTELKWPKKAS